MRQRVGDQDVHVAVVVIVEECRAVAVDFDDVVLGCAAADIEERDAGLLGDVDEANQGPGGWLAAASDPARMVGSKRDGRATGLLRRLPP